MSQRSVPLPTALATVLAMGAGLCAPARVEAGPCDRIKDVEICYHDDGRTKKASESRYEGGREVGPKREWREDGTLERVYHFKPNLGAYATEVLYYETGDVRRAQFHSPGSEVTINYAVSGRIHQLSCLPGAAGGYAYTV